MAWRDYTYEKYLFDVYCDRYFDRPYLKKYEKHDPRSRYKGKSVFVIVLCGSNQGLWSLMIDIIVSDQSG